MERIAQRPKQLLFITLCVYLLGVMMLAYWILYIARGMPLEGIPILSELVAAALALVAATGLVRMRRWSLPLCLLLAGMWCYGVLAGINLVLENGLDFASPLGALTDALLFPMVLAFSLYMATYVWRNRELFDYR